MNERNEIVEQRMQAFLRACRAAGARLTRQREEIFQELAASDAHPDAEFIHAQVRRRIPGISLDTVYRTLWWLSDLGVATVLSPSQDRTRFDANLSRHHHFVCTRCGLMRDFTCEELDNLVLPEAAKAIGSIQKTQVEVKGICHACEAKEQARGAMPETPQPRQDEDPKQQAPRPRRVDPVTPVRPTKIIKESS